jgi:hypothetical protein
LGRTPEHFARVGVQEHQRLGLDADDHRAPAEDLGCEDLRRCRSWFSRSRLRRERVWLEARPDG